jgi:riboflavin synthase
MFTGIIEGLGTITGLRSSGQGKRLIITADFLLDPSKVGDSISVSGACLTVILIQGKRFEVDVSPETVATTTFGSSKIGDRVNLERAMRLTDRLDGHLVTGHVDGVGIVNDKKTMDNATILNIGVPQHLLRYMIKKGSVAVDGISLTINDRDKGSFEVSVIPHTSKLTTMGFKKRGAQVNIETDLIGKYIERFITLKQTGENRKESGRSSIDIQFLTKTGFL